MDIHIRNGAVIRMVRRPDAVALLSLLAGIVLVCLHRFYYDNWLARHDLLTFFLPWHGYLGEQLRNFDIPGWNPALFAGTPFLGDPESGWMYFPAVVLFPFLQVTVAFKAMILVQLLIGGASTYSLGRVLGFGVLGSLLSATAFTFGPFLTAQTDCCSVGAGISGWLPLAFLGVEIGLRSSSWRHRFAAWAISGVAISQMLAAWLGQGAAIGLLMIASWIAYRGLLDPPIRRDIRQRIEQTLISGISVLAIGIGLSAWGLLPRLAVNAESTIRGGDYTYAPGARDEFPVSVAGILDYLLRDGPDRRATAIGSVVAVLIVFAMLLARRRYGMPYFLATWIGVSLLATPRSLLHDLHFLIPRLEELQMHSPTRVFWMSPILPAMLAGAGLRSLLDQRGNVRLLPLVFVPPGALYIVRDYIEQYGRVLDSSAVPMAWVTSGIAALILIPWARLAPQWREIAPRSAAVALILLVFAWPNLPGIIDTVQDPHGAPGELQLWGRDKAIQDIVATTLAAENPGGAGEFLQGLQADGDMFRYVSYFGRGSEVGPNDSAPARRLEPAVVALLVNGRPMQLGLQQLSGYNPLQLLTYLEYLAVANGRYQDYHHADVFPTAADSPLIDMLNVEYFVVSTTLDPSRADVISFSSQGPEVYRDDLVVIYRNDSAFDRAWIVHDVRPAVEGDLALLDSGTLDAKTVAFVDGYDASDFPVAPATGVAESVVFESYQADSMRLRVTAGSDGFLVLGEIHADGWNAYVDGEKTRIYRTNRALRGVPVSSGEHTVELRYEPISATIGMWTTGLFGIGTIAIWSLVAVEWLRRRSA
jgi:hypothetical protein